MAHITKVSPFAPAFVPAMPVIDGVRFATAEAGIRYKGRTDLMVAVDAFTQGAVQNDDITAVVIEYRPA